MRASLPVAVALLSSASAYSVSSLNVFNQSESVAIYTSAALTLSGGSGGGGSPTFAVAADLNPPEFIEVYSGSGALAWTFSIGAGAYLVDMSRHCESAPVGSVDTFGAYLTAAGASIFGFASSGTGAPAWNLTLPGCNTDGGGGTYIGLEASDDGSR